MMICSVLMVSRRMKARRKGRTSTGTGAGGVGGGGGGGGTSSSLGEDEVAVAPVRSSVGAGGGGRSKALMHDVEDAGFGVRRRLLLRQRRRLLAVTLGLSNTANDTAAAAPLPGAGELSVLDLLMTPQRRWAHEQQQPLDLPLTTARGGAGAGQWQGRRLQGPGQDWSYDGAERSLDHHSQELKNAGLNVEQLPDSFDWRAYLRLNPDLQHQGIITEHSAIRHFLIFGMKERRRYSVPLEGLEHFDWRAYLELNPDIQDAARAAAAAVATLAAVSPDQQQQTQLGAGQAGGEVDARSAMPEMTEEFAFKHFKAVGRLEGRPHSPPLPQPDSWQQTLGKIGTYTASLDTAGVPEAQRTLVLFHVEDLLRSQDSIDVIINNVKVFASSIALHNTMPSTTQQQQTQRPQQPQPQHAFYLFNVVGATHNNPLLRELPSAKANVAVLQWDTQSSDLATHLRTLQLLNEVQPQQQPLSQQPLSAVHTGGVARAPLSGFSALFFSGSGARGPLIYRRRGDWLAQFRALLDSSNDVGIVGPTIGCEGAAHVQTYAFMLRATLLPLVLGELQHYSALSPWTSLLDYFEVHLSSVVRRAGLNIASLLTHRRLQQQFFDGSCASNSSLAAMPATYDAEEWCRLVPDEVVFLRWGGEAGDNGRYLCGKQLAMDEHSLGSMVDTMIDLSSSRSEALSGSQMQYVLPEAPVGGILYDLYKQYRQEVWRDRALSVQTAQAVSRKGSLAGSPLGVAAALSPPSPAGAYLQQHQGAAALAPQAATSEQTTSGQDNVCFLMRTASVHDPARAVRSKYDFEDMNLLGLVQCKYVCVCAHVHVPRSKPLLLLYIFLRRALLGYLLLHGRAMDALTCSTACLPAIGLCIIARACDGCVDVLYCLPACLLACCV